MPTVGNRRRVRARVRVGEREAGDLEALREPRQVVALLLLGAVVEQQLRRPERVRHHHRHRRGAAPGRELRDHLRVRVRREAFAAVRLRDDHPEEALVLDVLPDVRRQVARARRCPSRRRSRQSSSVSLSRNACSSADSVGFGNASSFDQSGLPEKRSPSHHTVPALIASASVSDIGGITLRNAREHAVADERAPRTAARARIAAIAASGARGRVARASSWALSREVYAARARRASDGYDRRPAAVLFVARRPRT